MKKLYAVKCVNCKGSGELKSSINNNKVICYSCNGLKVKHVAEHEYAELKSKRSSTYDCSNMKKSDLLKLAFEKYLSSNKLVSVVIDDHGTIFKTNLKFYNDVRYVTLNKIHYKVAVVFGKVHKAKYIDYRVKFLKLLDYDTDFNELINLQQL